MGSSKAWVVFWSGLTAWGLLDGMLMTVLLVGLECSIVGPAGSHIRLDSFTCRPCIAHCSSNPGLLKVVQAFGFSVLSGSGSQVFGFRIRLSLFGRPGSTPETHTWLKWPAICPGPSLTPPNGARVCQAFTYGSGAGFSCSKGFQ